jgi:CO/xanthine dehydrogenase Mo-binding subunit
MTGELVEHPHEQAPFGAKGCGESGTFGVSPAIANALFDAVGVRMLDAPFTPEKVLRAIRQAEGRPLGEE